jgi:hypothetical protein
MLPDTATATHSDTDGHETSDRALVSTFEGAVHADAVEGDGSALPVTVTTASITARTPNGRHTPHIQAPTASTGKSCGRLRRR